MEVLDVAPVSIEKQVAIGREKQSARFLAFEEHKVSNVLSAKNRIVLNVEIQVKLMQEVESVGVVGR